MRHPFDIEVYRRRRQDLMHFMRDGVAIIPTAAHQPRNAMCCSRSARTAIFTT